MKRITLILSAAIVAAATLINAAPVSAATSSGLSINPRKNYVMEPGKSATDKLTIGNLDRTKDLIVNLRIVDFTFMDESGTPKLNLAKNAQPTTWSMKSFLTLPENIKVPAGETKTVEIKISVPADQGAGSYYSAIEYAATTENGGNVNLSASGVTLAFLSVPGIVSEKMTLQKFGNFQPDKTRTSGSYEYVSTNQSPSVIAFALKNEGNVAEAPVASISLKDTFGNEVTKINDANPRKSLALIGQTRRFEACIKTVDEKVNFQGEQTTSTTCDKTSLKPGRYTATLNAFYGQNGNNTHEIDGVATFWYIPIWFIIVVVAIFFLILLCAWLLALKLRRKPNKGSAKSK